MPDLRVLANGAAYLYVADERPKMGETITLGEGVQAVVDKLEGEIVFATIPPIYLIDDETGIPVSVLDGCPVAWDVPAGRPFPREELSTLTAVSRERFEELRRLHDPTGDHPPTPRCTTAT